MKNDRYSMSFTTGGLFYRESVKLAALFIELNDWNAVRNKVLSENLLQARTQNTLKRVCREIISRLKTLAPHEIELLIHGSSQEQNYLLWIAVCHRYKFIADFAVEIIRERSLALRQIYITKILMHSLIENQSGILNLMKYSQRLEVNCARCCSKCYGKRSF